jgi:CheY-like chemotaxis protein
MTAGERALTILVVDDDEQTRNSLREILEEEGYGVATASNGQEAIEKLDGGDPPALILLDLLMPVMDGWQFLARQQSHPLSRPVPIVLLSGMAYIRDAPGVADFLSKPIRPEKLLSCIKRFCGEQRSA